MKGGERCEQHRLDLDLTRHLKRYGDDVIDFKQIPLPMEKALSLPIRLHARNWSKAFQPICHFFALISVCDSFLPKSSPSTRLEIKQSQGVTP
ncbi:hypothetical protein C7B82_24170 [Stenomitos frigidus ULC18]|uniref:Uncharacterized protein n=1 Tax=Stenomitos frigidus ULC18 TaxID=2107698 RepID=A0A2T1DXL8_9CYAN|nr:hypothetical protein C7B82_24170 [Stenomitos frigidus ULC18]